jgi:hypothetical protein
LPKHWGGPVGGGEVAEQLAAKQLNHNTLLMVLGDAGILPSLPPPTIRCLSTSNTPFRSFHCRTAATQSLSITALALHLSAIKMGLPVGHLDT